MDQNSEHLDQERQLDQESQIVNFDQLKHQETKKLRELLLIPSELRSTSEICQIAQYISNIKFLKDYKHKPEFLDLCRYIYVKTYQTKQVVFKQNEIGDAFYIILSGKVHIFIDSPTEFTNMMELKYQGEINQGNAFGEIALLHNSKRTATIIAAEQTDLIILQKDIFQTYIKEIKNSHLSQLAAFLESLNLFTLFPKSKILELTTKCQVKKYPSNTIILKQGNDAAALYFIRTGQAKVLKLIPFRIYKNSKKKIINDISDPTSQEIQQSLCIYEFIEIDVLSDGQTFGEYALMNQVPMDHTVITTEPCEIVYVTIFDLNRIIPEENWQIFKQSLKKYPENRELRQMYWEKRNWSQFKKQLLNDIQCDKQNKLRFEQRLRLPNIRQSHSKIPFNKIDIKASDTNLYFTVLGQEQNSVASEQQSVIVANSKSIQRNEESQQSIKQSLTSRNIKLQKSKTAKMLLGILKTPHWRFSDKYDGTDQKLYYKKASLPIIKEHLERINKNYCL